MTPALDALCSALQRLGVPGASPTLLRSGTSAKTKDSPAPEPLLRCAHVTALVLHERLPSDVAVTLADPGVVLEYLQHVLHARGSTLPVTRTAAGVLGAMTWLAVDARALLRALPAPPPHLDLATAVARSHEDPGAACYAAASAPAAAALPNSHASVPDQVRVLMTRITLLARQAERLQEHAVRLRARYRTHPLANASLHVAAAARRGAVASDALARALQPCVAWQRERVLALQQEAELIKWLAQAHGEHVLLPRVHAAQLTGALHVAEAALQAQADAYDHVCDAWDDLNAALSEHEQASLLAALQAKHTDLRDAAPSFTRAYRAALAAFAPGPDAASAAVSEAEAELTLARVDAQVKHVTTRLEAELVRQAELAGLRVVL